MSQLWALFIAFLQAGVLGFGGGPGVVPFIKQQVVESHGWMTDANFANALAFGNALPGPIATKLAAYIGFRVAGAAGAGVALLATFGPTALVMILVYGFYQTYKDSPYVAGALTGVKPVVVVLLLMVAFSIAQKSFPGAITWVIGGVAALAVFWLHVNPAIIVAVALAAGAFLKL